VATSNRYRDSLHDIEREWTMADVWDALDVITALEEAEAKFYATTASEP
jgi:hypothetical protein